MPDNRILLIENPACLSVDLGRIKISRQDHEDAYVLPNDIAVLCLHHHTVNLTVNVLRVLSEAGAVVLVTNQQHLPIGLHLPFVATQTLTQRLYSQIAILNTDLVGELWAQLIQAKIATQAANLRSLGLKGALRLERLITQVKPGDPSNAEAQAAKHYWKHIFDNDFKRKKRGAMDGTNVRLNYGYAVLRAMIARQLVMCGLNPALGLGHNSKVNPFNLADDFIEPFRFLVERHVRRLDFSEDSFKSADKPQLLAFIEQSVVISGQDFRLTSAISESISSYCRLIENGKGKLILPENATDGD
jgi:CRISPR-associated protein Cas1